MVLCNLYKICRCSVSSFYLILCLNTQQHPSQLGVGDGGTAAQLQGFMPQCYSTGQLDIWDFVPYKHLGHSDLQRQNNISVSFGIWVPESFRHMAWYQLTSLFLLHYNFLFCCCEFSVLLLVFFFKKEKKNKNRKRI